MEKIDQVTPNIEQENIDRLCTLFPSVATEVRDEDGNVQKSIDFDALRQMLGDVAEGQRERYQFTWPGKRDAKAEAYRPIDKTMRPEKEKSVNWDTTQNLYIEGDNLEALKLLRNTYAGRVKLIYIDPPYNTGHDFVYDDDFSKTKAEYDSVSADYDEEGGRLVENLESNGRFHSDWCLMIYPRLLLARDLLSDDGAIFISIDDSENANLRKICDEVFGSVSFVGDIAWQRTYSPRNDSKGIPAEIEHIVVYAKTAGWIPNRLPRTTEMDAAYKNPDNDVEPWASADLFAPGAPTHQGMVYAVQHPFTGDLIYPPAGRCWTYEQQQILSLMNEWAPYQLREINDEEERARICGVSKDDVRQNVAAVMLAVSKEEAAAMASKRYRQGHWPKLYFTSGGKGGVRRKTYLSSLDGKMPTNFWPYSEVGHTDEAKKQLKTLFNGAAPFETPKPVRLLDHILTVASDPDSLVLDFFSGSATTAEAVMRKNVEDSGSRRYIMVQLPEEVSGQWHDLCQVGEERIRRAGAKIKTEVEESNRQLKLGESPKELPDIGFRVLRIDSSNFGDTYAVPQQYSQENLSLFQDNLKDDRSALDLLSQVLPAFRIPYSAPIEEFEVCGKHAFNVNDGQLIACFDTDVSTDCIETIAKMRPLYAVLRDASLVDDATAANFEELFKTYSPDTVRKVI